MKGGPAISVFVILFFSSCIVTHSGNVTGGPLITANDKSSSVAKGTARTFMIFPIGGNYSTTLIQDAKTDMYKHCPLKEGEYYANFTCDITKTYLLLYYSTKVTISADIVKGASTSR
jgi:hypothetical protein